MVTVRDKREDEGSDVDGEAGNQGDTSIGRRWWNGLRW